MFRKYHKKVVKGIIITHYDCYYYFFEGGGGINYVLEQKSFILQNIQSLTETRAMGPENILWKIDLDQIIFLYFTGIRSLKYM